MISKPEKKPMMQYRMKESPYFYAPARDIVNWMKAAISAALNTAVEKHPRNKKKLVKFAQQLAVCVNESLVKQGPLSPADILEPLVKSLDSMPCAAEFEKEFTRVVFTRFIAGVRETTQDLTIPVEELETALYAPGFLSYLPDNLRRMVEVALVSKGVLPRVMGRTSAGAELVENEGDDGK